MRPASAVPSMSRAWDMITPEPIEGIAQAHGIGCADRSPVVLHLSASHGPYLRLADAPRRSRSALPRRSRRIGPREEAGRLGADVIGADRPGPAGDLPCQRGRPGLVTRVPGPDRQEQLLGEHTGDHPGPSAQGGGPPPALQGALVIAGVVVVVAE